MTHISIVGLKSLFDYQGYLSYIQILYLFRLLNVQKICSILEVRMHFV